MSWSAPCAPTPPETSANRHSTPPPESHPHLSHPRNPASNQPLKPPPKTAQAAGLGSLSTHPFCFNVKLKGIPVCDDDSVIRIESGLFRVRSNACICPNAAILAKHDFWFRPDSMVFCRTPSQVKECEKELFNLNEQQVIELALEEMLA